MVVCFVGEKKRSVGVLLAGIKKWYPSLENVREELVVIVDPTVAEREKERLEEMMLSRVVVKLPREDGSLPERSGRL